MWWIMRVVVDLEVLKMFGKNWGGGDLGIFNVFGRKESRKLWVSVVIQRKMYYNNVN